MEKVIKFGDIETQKRKFHQHKEPISIKNIDINEIVVSNKTSFGKKGFPTRMLKKLDLYAYFSFVFFFDYELLGKDNEIWNKVKILPTQVWPKNKYSKSSNLMAFWQLRFADCLNKMRK